MDSIEFLKGREQSCREYAANINPCADADDKIKAAVLERADEFRAVIRDIERLRGVEALFQATDRDKVARAS